MNKLIKLQEGYKSKEEKSVGYSFLDENNTIIMQHPKDNNSIRRLIWSLYLNKNKE